MFLQRNKRGRLQQVRKPKDKEKFSRLKATGTILDPPIWIDPGESPLPLRKEVFDLGKGTAHVPPKNARLPDRSREPPPNNTRLPHRSGRPHVSNATKIWVDTASAANRYLPHEDPENYPLDQEPELPPPAPDPPRGPRRPRNRPAPGPPHGVRRPANPPIPNAGDYPPDREPQFPSPSPDPPRRTPRRARPPSPGQHPTDREEESPQPTPDPRRRTPRRVRPPSPDPEHHPPDREEVLLLPSPDPPRRTRRPANSPASTQPNGTRRPARPPTPETVTYRGPPQRFDVNRVFIRDPKELFAEASKDISLSTGTAYPCTQKDLDTCGGKTRRTSRTRDHAQLRAMWFSQPNKSPSVSIKTAAREIFEHNDSKRTERILPVKEREAIDRLLAMLEKACQDPWGPDLAIKTFCDLDAVFFRGKLKGHVCITWVDVGEFPERNVFGHTIFLGQGKAVIQLNAQFVFFDWGVEDGRLFAQMLATVLHEML